MAIQKRSKTADCVRAIPAIRCCSVSNRASHLSMQSSPEVNDTWSNVESSDSDLVYGIWHDQRQTLRDILCRKAKFDVA